MNLESNVFNGGLTKCAVNECNGKLKPLVFNFDYSKNATTMNPSIYNDNGVLRACVRGTNYTLHHSVMGKYAHWGSPLQYVHPEHDVRLATENYIIQLDSDLNITDVKFISMNSDSKPLWVFHGLEDARLIRWDNRLLLCGVRRDTTTNGQGRMELSEIKFKGNFCNEIQRDRIPVMDESSYCEKNWMPIIDQPYTFVKWSNPLEIVKYDPIKLTTTLVKSGDVNPELQYELRGGSQVIPYKDYYIAIVHSMDLWKPVVGEKNGAYYHHIIVWDKEFNLIKVTDRFKFIDFSIEFCCGMCLYNEKLIISFSACDNVPYLLELDPNWLINKILD